MQFYVVIYVSWFKKLDKTKHLTLILDLEHCFSPYPLCEKYRLAAQQMLRERVYISQSGVVGCSLCSRTM